MSATRTDWAAVCSVAAKAVSILIFRIVGSDGGLKK